MSDGRQVVPIDTFDPATLPAEERTECWLQSSSGAGMPIMVPALVARGAASGPALLAVAGVHGNEYEGMEAIRLVFADLDPTSMVGCFVGLPIANPFAYEARSRVTPPHLDGLNLARVFPGDAHGSPTQALAARLLDLAERVVGVDGLLVDLHSGSHDVEFATLIGFRDRSGPARERSEAAARHFGIDRLWRIPDAGGPFNAETTRRGIPTIATETTGRAGCDPQGTAAFARGLRAMLALLGITPGETAPCPLADPGASSVDVITKTAGFLRTACRLEDRVERGQLLGTIVSPFGEVLDVLRAPRSGWIWAVRATPVTLGGDLCFMIAEVDPPVTDGADAIGTVDSDDEGVTQ
jgi:predicted deacylase